MTTFDYTLAVPPTEPRSRELWLQNAAGFILMENVRQAAIDQLVPTLSAAERAVALEAIDATMWQLMATLDGMNGSMQNAQYQVELHLLVQLREHGGSETRALDVRDGDGMCLGLAGWLEGDYGDYPVVTS